MNFFLARRVSIVNSLSHKNVTVTVENNLKTLFFAKYTRIHVIQTNNWIAHIRLKCMHNINKYRIFALRGIHIRLIHKKNEKNK